MKPHACPPLIRHASFVMRHWFVVLGSLFLWSVLPARAFPPAPNHTFYGLVRDEMGDPLVVTNAVVILETSAGVHLKTTAVPNLGPGLNYRLAVPMDAGLTADAYKPTALKPLVSFRLKVVIGTTTYLPMELHGNYANLGQPAQSTHLDLTLGEDSDHDGLPDAWERALIDMLGGGRTLADIQPGDDSDGDGLTNLQEYQVGTYAFDPADGLRLEPVGLNGGRPLLDFLAIRGRTYSLLGSADLQTWLPVDFRFTDSTEGAAPVSSYSATDVRVMHVEVVLPAGQAPTFQAYKLMAQ
jgi:hypothetical protein